MIDTKSEAGAWERELDQRPKCAHKTVRHTPRFSPPTDNGAATMFQGVGAWSDRWICESCGQEFMPKVSP